VGLVVPLELRRLEVEPATGALAHGGEGAPAHAVADLVGRAIEIGRRRVRAQEPAAGVGGWGGRRHDGRRPLHGELAGDPEEVLLAERQLVDEVDDIAETPRCGEQRDGARVHDQRALPVRAADPLRSDVCMPRALRAHPDRPRVPTASAPPSPRVTQISCNGNEWRSLRLIEGGRQEG
jgi:hypothetical protein